MAFLTDRKRAVGMGSAKQGTQAHWAMTISSYGLLILVPLFVFNFGPMLGEPHADVAQHFARPYPAIIAALTLVAGFMHFKKGVRVLIEDYVHGYARELLIIGTSLLSYAAAATAVFSIARLAL